MEKQKLRLPYVVMDDVQLWHKKFNNRRKNVSHSPQYTKILDFFFVHIKHCMIDSIRQKVFKLRQTNTFTHLQFNTHTHIHPQKSSHIKQIARNHHYAHITCSSCELANARPKFIASKYVFKKKLKRTNVARIRDYTTTPLLPITTTTTTTNNTYYHINNKTCQTNCDTYNIFFNSPCFLLCCTLPRIRAFSAYLYYIFAMVALFVAGPPFPPPMMSLVQFYLVYFDFAFIVSNQFGIFSLICV